jgi:gamma-glutamyltranspeptidase/glutathione hydrolase
MYYLIRGVPPFRIIVETVIPPRRIDLMSEPWDFVNHPHRPATMGCTHVIASGHYLASQVGFMILEAGGNAIDAGVAAGICLNVLEGQQCSFAGVAPIMIRSAAGEIVTIDGLGTWPAAASCEFFRARGHTVVPEGILQTVVPGAPDAWMTALARFGTMRFRDVVAPAIRFAREGYPLHPEIVANIERLRADFPAGSEAERIFRPGGKSRRVGEIFVQAELAATLQFLADEDSASPDRLSGIAAARRAFYGGDIARAIVRHQTENGGLMTMSDLAAYRVTMEPPIYVDFFGTRIYSCGPWCQGPILLQELKLLQGYDLALAALGHNSPAYIHLVTEIVKLAAADREAYYGDPKFIDVPMTKLLSDSYAVERRKMIDPDNAWPDMPPPGLEPRRLATPAPEATPHEALNSRDTSYVCVVDRYGNAFSATPSDGITRASPVVPGLGFAPSSRGVQSRVDPLHPSSIAPGKRPRLTPNPALAVHDGRFVMPFGTPGGDQQTQAMLQFVLNALVFGQSVQRAVEAPRFYSHSFPDSFAPHTYTPGLLYLEKPIADDVAEALAGKGHRVDWWPASTWPKSSVCAILDDRVSGVKHGAADSRRTATALGR